MELSYEPPTLTIKFDTESLEARIAVIKCLRRLVIGDVIPHVPEDAYSGDLNSRANPDLCIKLLEHKAKSFRRDLFLNGRPMETIHSKYL